MKYITIEKCQKYNHLNPRPNRLGFLLMLKHNRYGYKVCYKEQNSNQYIQHFITYTYSQAKLAKYGYLLYPQNSRLDNHILQNPKWKIFPITKTEALTGIWEKDPF